MSVAERMRQLREQAGLSVAELALRLGWDENAVAACESGSAPISAELLPSLAAALGVAPAAFYPATPEPSLTPALARELGEIRAVLELLERRVAAFEPHLGIPTPESTQFTERAPRRLLELWNNLSARDRDRFYDAVVELNELLVGEVKRKRFSSLNDAPLVVPERGALSPDQG